MFVRALSLALVLVIAFSVTGSASALDEPALPQGEHWGAEGVAHPNSCNATGWAEDSDNPAREVTIRILVDGDEKVSGATEGHEFHFNLWGQISNYVDHVIKAQAYDEETGQWVDLASTPKMLNCVNYDIYILNTKTGIVERLTKLGDTGEYNPSWSPDGMKIVHDATDAYFHALYITDVKTHVSKPLPGADGGNDASWSPNGKWIVFDRRWHANDTNLYLLPPSGGTPKLVVSNAVNGDWSPYSQRLVFERDGGLWTASLKGHDEKRIAEAGFSPVWSPNGMWIAYDLNGDIWKVRVNDAGARVGNPVQLTTNPANEGGPNWSPDSKRIVFGSDASGDHDIWRMSAEGGALTRLVRTSIYGDYDPDFASNGQYIAYEGAKEPSQPYIVAFPEWGYIEGQDWPMGDTVHLTIDDPATKARPDYEAEQPTVATSWGNWWVQFNFDYDLKVGDKVTETDGYVTRTHTVRNLGVTDNNFGDNTVAGIAEPGAVIYLWIWGHDESYMELIAAWNGTWLADFDSVGFDLAGGMCGRAEVRDKIGNRTAVDWCTPNPWLNAFPAGDTIFGVGWPKGSEVHLSINNGEYAQMVTVQGTPWNPDEIVALFAFGGLYDLKPGDVVTLSGSGEARTHTVQNLTITTVNKTANTIAGTGDTGAVVHVSVWGYQADMDVIVENGTWLADFNTRDFDLVEDMCGRTEIRVAGNGTAVDWCIPRLGWQQVNTDGFGNLQNAGVSALEVFGDRLYAGASNWIAGGQIWRLEEDGQWIHVSETGFGDGTTNAAIIDLAVFQGQLYAGTGWYGVPGQVWRSSDGTNWNSVTTDGFDTVENIAVTNFIVFQNMLYAGTGSVNGSAQIWRSATGDSDSWTQVAPDGSGLTGNVTGLAVYDGELYAAVEPTFESGASVQVWRSSNGSDWTTVINDGFGSGQNVSVGGFAQFGGYLYLGTRNDTTGAQLWRTLDGTNWQQVVGNGFGDLNNVKIEALLAYNGLLYAATNNSSMGLQIWRSADGLWWEQVAANGFGNSGNSATLWNSATLEYQGQILLGTWNNNGGEVWESAP
jgi:Tol biopolymer transport system component